MIAKLICQLRGHHVHRRHVWNDGYDYRTSCRRCSAELIRDPYGWREYEDERDGGLPRKGHPHHAT